MFKKNGLLLFLLICCQTAVLAQASSRLYIYKGSFNNRFGRGDNMRPFEGRLMVDGEHSLFTMKEEAHHAASLQEHTIDLRPDSLFTVYKEQGSASLLFEFIDLSHRSHWFADTLFPMEWTLLDEEKPIGAIPCRKAVTWFKGRGYTAWYAPSITISDGPWKLGGLPGLILEAHDDEQQWHMTYVSEQDISGFDHAFFDSRITKGVEGYSGFSAHVKKIFNRLEASLGVAVPADCVGCQSKPVVKLHSWEKSD
jgi:GLPGLI family protein